MSTLSVRKGAADSQGFAPAAGPLDIQCWIADLPKYMSEERAKESSEAAVRWPKGTQQEPNRSHEEAKRSPRGAQEEAKKMQRGAHEEPRGGQEEPKRNPREGLWSPEAENTGPRARPTKTFVKNESWSV